MFKRLLFLAATSLVIFGCSKSTTTQEVADGATDVAAESAAVDVSVDVTESVDVTPVSSSSDVSPQD